MPTMQETPLATVCSTFRYTAKASIVSNSFTQQTSQHSSNTHSRLRNSNESTSMQQSQTRSTLQHDLRFCYNLCIVQCAAQIAKKKSFRFNHSCLFHNSSVFFHNPLMVTIQREDCGLILFQDLHQSKTKRWSKTPGHRNRNFSDMGMARDLADAVVCVHPRWLPNA